jgi:hypothetical protein
MESSNNFISGLSEMKYINSKHIRRMASPCALLFGLSYITRKSILEQTQIQERLSG